MFRKLTAITIASLFLLTAVGAVFALEKGNKRKGKYTYRKVYKACNARGEVASPVPSISPSDKTQAEWADIFENGKLDEFGCGEEWNALSETDMSDIYSYLYEHASDSPTPAKCK
jgi:hypothetical protein